MNYRPLVGAVVMTASLIPSFALAQTAVDSAPVPEDGRVFMSPFEVSAREETGYAASTSVSATRMRVDLQQHPQSLTVVTSELLNDIDAFTISDALRYVAGVQPYGAVEGRFSIHGSLVNSVKRNGFDTSAEAISDMVFTDRIEVVKGPASLLYGLGTPGGIINIITKKPPAHPIDSIKLEDNTEGDFRAELDVGGPIGSSGSGYRIMAMSESGDTFAFLEKNRKKAIGESFAWQILPATKLSVDFDYLDYHPHERTMTIPVNFARTDYIRVPRDWSISGPNAFRSTIERNFFLTLDQKLGENFFFRNYFEAYDSNNKLFRRTVDNATASNTTINATSVSRIFDRLNYIDQSDLIGSYHTSLGDIQFDAGYTFNDSIQRDQQWNQAGAAYAANPFPIFAYDTTPLNSIQFAPGSNAFTGTPTTNWQHVEIEDNAVYALLQYKLWQDRINIFGGYRRDAVRQYFLDHIAQTNTYTKTLFHIPQFGISVTPVAPVSLYVAHSESAQANSNFPQNPQTGKSLDAGIKFNFTERLSGAISYFDTKLNNIQRTLPSSTTTVLSGQEQYQGFDADLVYSPIRAWQIVASYSYNDARTLQDTVATAVGRQLPSTPLNTVNLFNKYRFESGWLKGVFVGGGLNAHSSEAAFVTSSTDYLIRTPGFAKFDALLGWGGRWHHFLATAQINLENITDRTYLDRQLVYGTPRTALLSLTLGY